MSLGLKTRLVSLGLRIARLGFKLWASNSPTTGLEDFNGLLTVFDGLFVASLCWASDAGCSNSRVDAEDLGRSVDGLEQAVGSSSLKMNRA